MSQMRKLKGFYKRIPEVTKPCPSGCTGCCGIVPWSKAEAQIAYEVSGEYPSVDIAGNCCYIRKDGCAIYEHRPFMCRIYGHGPAANQCCEQGMRSDGLSPEDMRKLIQDYQDWVEKNGHTVMPKGAEEFIRREAARNKKIQLKGF